MSTQNSQNTIVTINADGFDISGGVTPRKLALSGGDVSIVGSSTPSTIIVPPGSITLPVGYATTVTVAGVTVLVASSLYQQFFTGATTQTVVMPVVSTLTLGRNFQIVNNSTDLVTVNSSGGNAIIVLVGGTSAILTCIAITGTDATVWSVSYLGVNVTSGKKLTVPLDASVSGTNTGDNAPNSTGNTVAPASNTDSYIPQWNGLNSKTLKDGLAVPAGGLAGITGLNAKLDNSALGTVNQVLHGNPSGALAFSPVVEANISLSPGSSVNDTKVGTHGLAPALSGVNTQFFRGDGVWALPASVTIPNAYAEESFGYTANVAHNIVHDFGARPLVQCITSTNDIIIPITINHVDLDTVAITFDDSATYDVILTLGSMPLDVYVSTSISYIMLVDDTLIEVTAGSKIITLVTPVGRVGKKVTVKNSSTGICDVITAAGLIEGVADVTIPSTNSYDFRSNGTNWIIT